jgi:hypothetical protein
MAKVSNPTKDSEFSEGGAGIPAHQATTAKAKKTTAKKRRKAKKG